jgi:very-short-patch-repair endonuclease
MRSHPTRAESFLWTILRAKRIGGFKFRRQHPIGNYIADFVCLAARLIIEVDGGAHGEHSEARDEHRIAYFAQAGFRVIRFRNLEVLQSPAQVADVIEFELGVPQDATRETLAVPSPHGGERGLE